MSHSANMIWGSWRALGPRRSNVLSTLGLLTLVSCSGVPQDLKVLTAQVEVPRPPQVEVLPLPSPVTQQPLQWRVVTPSRIPAGKGWVLFALTPEGYETLSRNTAEIIRWMTEASFQLKHYTGGNNDGQSR